MEPNYEPTDSNEWSEEAKRNMIELLQTLIEMEKEDRKRTPEERERNAIGFTCEDGKFVYY